MVRASANHVIASLDVPLLEKVEHLYQENYKTNAKIVVCISTSYKTNIKIVVRVSTNHHKNQENLLLKANLRALLPKKFSLTELLNNLKVRLLVI